MPFPVSTSSVGLCFVYSLSIITGCSCCFCCSYACIILFKYNNPQSETAPLFAGTHLVASSSRGYAVKCGHKNILSTSLPQSKSWGWVHTWCHLICISHVQFHASAGGHRGQAQVVYFGTVYLARNLRDEFHEMLMLLTALRLCFGVFNYLFQFGTRMCF